MAGAKTEIMSKEAFVQGFITLALGTLGEKLTIVFKMLDFKNQGTLERDDCELLLKHIPSFGAESPHLPKSER